MNVTERQLEAELAAAREDYRLANQRVIELLDEKIALTKQRDEFATALARATSALEWYASPLTWNRWMPDAAGDRARQALERNLFSRE